MSHPSIPLSVYRFSCFDGVEIKQASFLNKDFPTHFHHEWSLSLIKSGSEIIQSNNLEFQLHSDSLILLPPYLPHANKGHQNAGWEYASLYINKEAVQSIISGIYSYLPKGHDSSYTISYNKELVNIFKQIIGKELTDSERELKIKKIIFSLLSEKETFDHNNSNKKIARKQINEIISFLKQNCEKKITLDDLSDQYKLDKYKLLRSFRASTGLTPQNYLTALRIEASKQLLFQRFPLVEVALETGFYDQSHFTNTFKKYVGVSPLSYQNNCNILQDIQ
jgi:AraC-like DNA-binding protein